LPYHYPNNALEGVVARARRLVESFFFQSPAEATGFSASSSNGDDVGNDNVVMVN
jgi:hypothetical protein